MGRLQHPRQLHSAGPSKKRLRPRPMGRLGHARQGPRSLPPGPPGRPEDIAGAAVFLAARAGAWVSGQTIVVDGGWAVGRGA